MMASMMGCVPCGAATLLVYSCVEQHTTSSLSASSISR
jgi:hypothetical protein